MFRIGGSPSDPGIPNKRIAVDKEHQYASKWFTDNPGKKPELIIIPGFDKVDNNFNANVVADLESGELDPRNIVKFMGQNFFFTGVNDAEEWISFDRVINPSRGRVTVLNLFDISATEKAPPLKNLSPVDDKAVHRAMIIISAAYRILHAKDTNYVSHLCKEAENLLQSNGFAPFTWTNVSTTFKSWLMYAPLRKMMAGIDMFLNKYPEHEFKLVRFGTIITRFKDCGVLTEFHYLSTMTDLTYQEIGQWAWTKRLGDQICRIFKSGEEIDNEFSYTMYMIEMGLSMRSPYSTTINPELHLWIHIIGCGFKEERSKNARIAGVPEKQSVLASAQIIIFVLGRFATFEKQFDADKTFKIPDMTKEVKLTNDEEMPKSKDADEWLGYIKESNGMVPLQIQKFVAIGWSKLAETRPGSVGRFLVDTAAPLIATDD